MAEIESDPGAGNDVGLEIFREFIGESTLATGTVVITEAVPAGKIWKLQRVFVSCRQPVQYRVKIDSAKVGSGRVGSGEPDSLFVWVPSRSAAAAKVVSVEIDQTSGVKSNLEVYLMAIQI